MARLADRLPENAAGDFYVDATCIDCGTCREIAPETFSSEASETDQSYVLAQPTSQGSVKRALMALVACPTASIGTRSKPDARPAIDAFPELVARDDVYYCGFAAESSFGARSYLVRRAAGNVLVDSPRAARPLFGRIRELGGASILFLTHRDDVADHEAYAAELGCARVLHRDDVTRSTARVERKLEGDEPVRLAEDLIAIPVPGHTRGSAALLFHEVLFTGDHLWGEERTGALHASRSVCWYSWAAQTRSVERLLDFSFEVILPGHGARYRAESPAAMRRALVQLVTAMKRGG